MKWTWDKFGIRIDRPPRGPEPHAVRAEAPETQESVTESPISPAPINTAPINTAPINTAPINTAPINTAPVSTAPLCQAPLQAPTSPAPVAQDRTPTLILDSLRLGDHAGVRVQFYDQVGKAVVIVPAKDVNPTWQEIELASHQSGWSVEVCAVAKFERLKELALSDFSSLDFINAALAQTLFDHGYFTLQDLTSIKPAKLMQLGKLDLKRAHAIIRQAKIQAEQMEI